MNPTNYEYEISRLTRARASFITETLKAAYDPKPGPYQSAESTKLYREGMPSCNYIQFESAKAIADVLGLDTHAPVVDFIQRAYPEGYPNHPVYHGITHAVLTAHIAKRLAAIYLPNHGRVARTVVLAALLHDAHHTQTPNDSVNIERAIHFTEHLMRALYGNVTDAEFDAGDDLALVCAIIQATKFEGGVFTERLPVVNPVPLEAGATFADLYSMAVRIVGEADLMMSATPAWPEFAALLAYEADALNNSTQILDPVFFSYRQWTFAHMQLKSGRIMLPENVAAMQIVIDIHKEISRAEDADDDPDRF